MWDDGPQWQNVCFRGEPRWSLIRILLEILWIAMIGINGGCHQQTWLGNTIDGYNQRRIYVDGGYPKHVTWTGTWTGKWWDCKSWDSGVPYFQSSSYVESVLRMLKPCKSFLLRCPDFQKHLFLEPLVLSIAQLSSLQKRTHDIRGFSHWQVNGIANQGASQWSPRAGWISMDFLLFLWWGLEISTT